MHRLVGVLEQAVRRDEDHLALRPLLQHRAGGIQAVHARHLDVQNGNLYLLFLIDLKGFPAVGCLENPAPAAIFRHLHRRLMLEPAHDDIRQRLPLHPLIIRDQQTNHSSNSSSFSTSGRYRITAVPRPGRERTTTRQRASSSRRRAATL